MKYKYDFDSVISRKNTSSLKCEPKLYKEVFSNADDNAIPFWVADMDFATAPCIASAIQKRSEHKIYGYTSPLDDFYKAILWWQKTRHNFYVKPEDISLFSGVVSIISHAVRAFSEKGDGIIVQQPVYHPFMSVVLENGRKLVNNELICDSGEYSVNFDDLEKKASDPNNKMLILCNPHNPIGRVWTKVELEKIADICYRNDVLVVSDEIHGDIVLGENEFVSFGTLDEKYVCKSIVCASMTKTFNLAGLTLGYSMVKDHELKEKLDKVHNGSHYMVNVFALEAAKAAYTLDGADWVNELCRYLTKSSEIIENFLKENLSLTVYKKPQATYLGWIDCSAYVRNDDELKERIPKSGLLLNYGSGFGNGGNGFVRWNFACPHSVLEKGLSRFKEAF